MQNYKYVFLGGMLGAFLRFIIQSLTVTTTMLWIVNIVGSFMLGFLNSHFETKENKFKVFFTTGMLGAFTTFSTFTQNWFEVLMKNSVVGITFGIGMTVACVVAAFLGYYLNRGKRFWNGY